MANKELKVTGFIGSRKRDDLPKTEQERLAREWNGTAMKEAGYSPVTELGPAKSETLEKVTA